MATFSYEPNIRHAAFAALFLVTAFLLTSPIIELFFFVPKSYNEGWNAFHAAHAFGEESLYPEIRELYSNNYPPVSFYIVGGLGSLIGDNIIAGRLVSIVSLLLVGMNIVAIVRLLGGDTFVSLFSGLLFVGFMSANASWYLGMNDPQLFAHAIMTSGLVLFLRGRGKRSYIFLTALVMLTAGMVKHTLVALPIALTVWLFIYARKDFVFWLLSSFLLLLAASVVLYAVYGETFFVSVFSNYRSYSIALAADNLQGWILPLQLYLAAAFLLMLVGRDSSDTVLIGLYVLVAGIFGSFISGGIGVSYNAMFDLIIAVVIASGLFIGTFARRCEGIWSRLSITYVVIAILYLPIINKVPFAVGRLMNYTINLPELELVVARDIDFIAKHEGPAMCESLALCYWAGKKFEVAYFSLGQKLEAGLVSESAITARLESRYFSVIQMDSEKGASDRLPSKVNDAILERYKVSRSSQQSGVFLEPSKSTD